MANWIKTLRERSNITQDELTARLEVEGFGISRSTLASWESGRYEPPLNNPVFRRAISKAMKVNIKTILKVAGYEVDDDGHSLYAEQAAMMVDQMSEDKQQLALRLLEQLTKS